MLLQVDSGYNCLNIFFYVRKKFTNLQHNKAIYLILLNRDSKKESKVVEIEFPFTLHDQPYNGNNILEDADR